MSTLYLIRHGQASFLADNYDVLSDRGVAQSQALGRHLAARSVHLDALYTGPRKRQIDTARHMVDAAANGLPEAQLVDEFDEYPFEDLMKVIVPKLMERDAELAEAMRTKNMRGMSAILERVTTAWSSGEYDDLVEDIETYTAFRERVVRGLEHVMAREGSGRTVAVVTSGGPISISLRHALDLDEHRTWRTAWIVRNASMSEFLYREDAFTLVAFNGTPHLSGADVTYR